MACRAVPDGPLCLMPGDETTRSGSIHWPDLNAHADQERAARHAGDDRVMERVDRLAERVDRLEALFDQMRGIRALIFAMFGTTIVGGLVSVIAIINAINAAAP